MRPQRERGSYWGSEDTPDVIKESAGWVTPNQTLTTPPPHTLPLISYSLYNKSVKISISSEHGLIPLQDEKKKDPGPFQDSRASQSLFAGEEIHC